MYLNFIVIGKVAKLKGDISPLRSLFTNKPTGQQYLQNWLHTNAFSQKYSEQNWCEEKFNF